MAEPTYTLLTLNDLASSDFNELLGIDDAGVAVGYFGSGISPDPFPTAVEVALPYAAANYQTLGQAGPYSVSGASTEAYAIDNLGSIVGSGSTGPTAAFTGVSLASGAAGTVTGFAGGAALGINDAGAMVGYSVSGAATIAVVPVGGKDTPLGAVTISGGSTTVRPIEATGINDADVITGFGTVTGGATVGFIYNEVTGGVTTLNGPNGGTFTEALGLNNDGEVVGEYKVFAGASDTVGVTQGFVYDIASGTYTTIEATASTVTGTGTVINGINDLGEIVGSYTTKSASGSDVVSGFLGYLPGSEVTIADPVAGSIIQVPAGYQSVAVGGAGAVTLVDPGVGQVTIVANTGKDTIHAYGAADTVIGGSGNDTVVMTGASDLVFLGGGANSVVAAGAATIVAGGTGDSIHAFGGGLVYEAGTGNMTVTGAGASGTATTIVGAGGALDAYAGDAAGDVVFAGSGASTLQGGLGESTLVGGVGATTMYGGGGGGLVWGGTSTGLYEADGDAGAAPTLFVVGQGNGANTVYASAGSTVFLTGSGSAFVADFGTSTVAGVATLVATASTGNTAFQLGAGSDLVAAGAGTTNIAFDDKGAGTVVGGTGQDIYTFAPDVAGGVYTIYDFKQGTDVIELGGASAAKTDLAGASFANGNTKLTLSTNGDTAKITFIGVHLTAGDFG